MASTSQASTTKLEEEPNLVNEFESHDDVLDDGDAAIQSTYERRKEKLADHWGELQASFVSRYLLMAIHLLEQIVSVVYGGPGGRVM